MTEIASAADTFADQVRDQYLFPLTDLSDAEHAVLKKAIDDGYFEDNDTFRSVIDLQVYHQKEQSGISCIVTINYRIKLDDTICLGILLKQLFVSAVYLSEPSINVLM